MIEQRTHPILRYNGAGGYITIEKAVPNAVSPQPAVNSTCRSDDYLEEARCDAQTLVDNAKKQGYEKGYTEACAEGYAESERQAALQMQPVADAISCLSDTIADRFTLSKDQYLFLEEALALTRCILYSELEKNDDAFYGQFRRAALHISNIDRATLKTGPRGYAIAQKDMKRLENAIEGLDSLDVVLAGDDDGLCVLETPLGTIDASLTSQLARARKILIPQE